MEQPVVELVGEHPLDRSGRAYSGQGFFGLQFVRGLAGLGALSCSVRSSDRQISDDLFSKNFVDLAMPGHRLGAPSLGLVKDIVSRSMAQENTSGLL